MLAFVPGGPPRIATPTDAPAVPRVGVVTVTYNSAAVLAPFLATMAAQRDVALTLVVIDNASTDGSADLAEAAAATGLDVRVVRNERNVGLANANNEGIATCLGLGAEWVVLMNNDTRSDDPRLFARLCAEASGLGALAASPAIVMTDPAGGSWFDGAAIHAWRGHQVKHHEMGAPLSLADRDAFTTDHLPACCLLLRPEVFERVGTIDEAFFVYGEDVDFSLRMRDAGIDRWVLGTARGALVHEHSAVTGGFLSTFTTHWLTRNWVLVHRKRARGVRLLLGLGYVQVWMLARLLARRERVGHYLRRQRGFRAGLRVPLEGREP